MIICIYCWAMLLFLCTSMLVMEIFPFKHWKSDLAKNYDVIDEISDYQRTFPEYICHFSFCIQCVFMYV